MNWRAWRLTSVSVAARGVQLLLFLAVGNRFGASELTDAVFFLQAPLVVLLGLVASTGDLVVMPAIHRAESRAAAASMRRRLVANALMAVVPLSLAGLAASALWTGWFDPAVFAVLLPMPVLATLSAVRVGLLNAHGRHEVAVLGPVYGALGGLAVLLVTPLTAVSLAAVPTAYELARLAGLSFHARRLPEGGGGPLTADLVGWTSRRTVVYAAATLSSSLNVLIDMSFAERLAVGAVTQVEYASRLWNVVPLLISGHLTLLHARLSRRASAGEPSYDAIGRAELRLGGAAVLLSAVAFVAAPWAIDLAYGFGRLGAAERDQLGGLLRCYLVGGGPFVVGLVYVRALSAGGQARGLAATALLSVCTNLVADALLVRWAGLYGIGLATSFTYLVTALFMARLVRGYARAG